LKGPGAGKGLQTSIPFKAINALDAEFVSAPIKAFMAFSTMSLALLIFLFNGKNRIFDGHKYGNSALTAEKS